MSKDQDQLRLLSIFHYVVGGMAALFSFMPLFHLGFGLLLVLAPEKFFAHGPPPPPFLGWMFIIIAAVLIVIGLALAILILTTARFLAKGRHYVFCFVVAAIECVFMPFGTVLGIFTIIVLSRDSVKELFKTNH